MIALFEQLFARAGKPDGFILHSDHSIPESTDYDTYRYFLDLGRQLGTYGT